MARADTYTLLSLDKYAQVMGINPMRFNGGMSVNISDGRKLFPLNNSVQGIWPQFSYQFSDQISRDDLAREIAKAESEIASFLNYWPAPTWISKEMHTYDRPYRRDAYGLGVDVRGKWKSIELNYGKFIAAGRRDTSVVEAGVTVTYSDPDGDGYDEVATVTTTTTLTDVCEIKVYQPGSSAYLTDEIRDPFEKTLVGGTFTAKFYTWQMIKPSVWDAFPTNDNVTAGVGINTTDTDNLLATADIYREFTNFALPSATFYTADLACNHVIAVGCSSCTSCDGSGCQVCELNTKDGCIHFRDTDNGIVEAVPATYDDDNERWNVTNFSDCRDPDNVRLWYYSGLVSEPFRRESTCDQMDNQMSKIIAYLATARMERPYPANNNVRSLADHLQRDTARTPRDGDSIFLSEEIAMNPFGTRHGEVMAYKSLKHLVRKVRPRVGVMT